MPGSKNFAIASEQKFLIGDGLLTKAWQIMDFLDKHTAWAKPVSYTHLVVNDGGVYRRCKAFRAEEKVKKPWYKRLWNWITRTK